MYEHKTYTQKICITFHIVAIFAEAGRSREAAFAYFIPHAMVSVTTSLSASTLADYIRLKPLLLVMLAGFMLGAVGLVFLHYQLGYWSLVLGFGVGGGLWGASKGSLWGVTAGDSIEGIVIGSIVGYSLRLAVGVKEA